MLTATSGLEYYQTRLWMELLCRTRAGAYCFRPSYSFRPGRLWRNQGQIPSPNDKPGCCAGPQRIFRIKLETLSVDNS